MGQLKVPSRRHIVGLIEMAKLISDALKTTAYNVARKPDKNKTEGREQNMLWRSTLSYLQNLTTQTAENLDGSSLR